MAYKTLEDKIKAVTKCLLKDFKASEEKRCIPIYNHFTSTSCQKYSGFHMVFHGDKEIDFGEMSDEEFGSLTCKIADAICAKLKVKKSAIVHRDTSKETYSPRGVWWSSRDYTLTKRIIVVYPCKEFLAINKKLKALGLKEIHFKDWYHCDVAGKRSSIFSRYYHYYAENSKKCQKVLDYLKGKKKLTYQFINVDDLEDRRRGEEYETEWYGSESKQLYFTDSKGHTTQPA